MQMALQMVITYTMEVDERLLPFILPSLKLLSLPQTSGLRFQKTSKLVLSTSGNFSLAKSFDTQVPFDVKSWFPISTPSDFIWSPG